jgi:hypothetical protein
MPAVTAFDAANLLLTLGILIFIFVPFPGDRETPNWEKSVPRSWILPLAWTMKLFVGIFTVISWILYAINPNDFIDNATSTYNNTLYFYVVINALLIVFILLAKALSWSAMVIDRHVDGDAINVFLGNKGLYWYATHILLILGVSVTILGLAGRYYNSGNTIWNFFIAAWSINSAFILAGTIIAYYYASVANTDWSKKLTGLDAEKQKEQLRKIDMGKRVYDWAKDDGSLTATVNRVRGAGDKSNQS